MQGGGAAAGSPLAADGKIYVATTEHTPTQPLFRGARLMCLDAYSGKLLWSMDGWWDVSAVAGGYIYARNVYDGLTYCIGKGQTSTTISAPQTAVTKIGRAHV
jgi:outer membrane protein assembly factor BamB